jgi:hypothetical protein
VVSQDKEELRRGFSERLNKALDIHPLAPPNDSGRQAWVWQELKKRGKEVSRVSVHKWFRGTNYPRPDTLPILADILKVDVGWLSYQVGAVTRDEKRLQNSKASGSVLIVAGFLRMSNISCAFPKEDSPHTHIIAIIGGEQRLIHVVASPDDANPVIRLPLEYAKCDNIMVRRNSDTEADLYLIPNSAVAQVGEESQGSISVTLSRMASGWLIGTQRVQRIHDFREALDT